MPNLYGRSERTRSLCVLVFRRSGKRARNNRCASCKPLFLRRAHAARARGRALGEGTAAARSRVPRRGGRRFRIGVHDSPVTVSGMRERSTSCSSCAQGTAGWTRRSNWTVGYPYRSTLPKTSSSTSSLCRPAISSASRSTWRFSLSLHRSRADGLAPRDRRGSGSPVPR